MIDLPNTWMEISFIIWALHVTIKLCQVHIYCEMKQISDINLYDSRN